MSKTTKLLNHIGLRLVKDTGGEELVAPQEAEYTLKNKPEDVEKLKLHRDFLKSIEAEENIRLTLIENKNDAARLANRRDFRAAQFIHSAARRQSGERLFENSFPNDPFLRVSPVFASDSSRGEKL